MNGRIIRFMAAATQIIHPHDDHQAACRVLFLDGNVHWDGRETLKEKLKPYLPTDERGESLDEPVQLSCDVDNPVCDG